MVVGVGRVIEGAAPMVHASWRMLISKFTRSSRRFVGARAWAVSQFDHYLKGAPGPKWMTEGLPQTRKGAGIE